MRNTKRCIAQFTFYDRTGIQAFLEKQAENGWMLEKISSLGWKFRRIEPKKLHFAVTYFHKASVFDPEPTEQQRTFQEFCEYAGWRLVDINGPLQIFCNEAVDPRPIETDPVTELTAIHASAKKNFLPSYIMLLFVAVMNIALQISQLVSFPLTYLSKNITIFIWLCQLCLLTMCCQEVFGYFFWHRKAKKAAMETGSFVETKGHRKSQLMMLGIITAALVWLLFSMEAALSTTMALTIMGIFFLCGGVLGLREIMKRLKASREMNRAVTIGACVVLSIAMCGVLTFSLVQIIQADFWEEDNSAEPYQVNGVTFYAYDHKLPLYVEDLTGTDYDRYSTWAYETGSILLSVREYEQEMRIGSGEDAPEIRYEIYDVHLPILYGLCRDALLREYEGWYSEDIYGNRYQDEYLAVDAAPWGAEEAFRLNSHAEAYNQYLLCYDDRLVTVFLSWEPNGDQMHIIGQRLGR